MAKWLGVTAAGVLATWLAGFLSPLLPYPEQAWLAVENVWPADRQRSKDRFRVVLCWLKNDSTGMDTENVANAFTGVAGIKLDRSARIVEVAPDAPEYWVEPMKQRARAVLEDWNGDLAIVGLVKKPGEVVSLWFVRHSGEGTLGRADQPYKLENVTLGKDFHGDLRTQLTATALAAVAPLATSVVRGRVFEKETRNAIEKLSNLLNATTIHRPQHLATLYMALGNALQTLGERESGSQQLEESVEAFRNAAKLRKQEGEWLPWAAAQSNLGVTLASLGEREVGSQRLEDALEAYRNALTVFTEEREPLDWARTQNNFGVALQTLGERETVAGRLNEAVEAFRKALIVRARGTLSLDWATTQNNLGNALESLGERETGTRRLEDAEKAFRKALLVFTEDYVPLDWAMTQNNLGNVLTAS